MARVLTVNDVLDGHVTLDIECLDYRNSYTSKSPAKMELTSMYPICYGKQPDSKTDGFTREIQ